VNYHINFLLLILKEKHQSDLVLLLAAVMCGILAVLGVVDNSQSKRARIIELSRRLRHRGPDWSGLHCHQDCYLAHQRLAIVDPTSGDQPLYNYDKTVIVTVRILSSICMFFFIITLFIICVVVSLTLNTSSIRVVQSLSFNLM